MDYKCKCNNIGSKYCINKYCRNCCTGINCNTHNYKTKECNCKMTFFDKYCIDKKCYSCCNNNKCEEHFLLCKCNGGHLRFYTILAINVKIYLYLLKINLYYCINLFL